MAKPSPIPDLAPDVPLSTAVPRILRCRLEDLWAYEPPLRQRSTDIDADTVHDARVATRRLRAVFSLCRRLKERVDEPERVAALARALGAVRDLDVARAWIEGHGAAADADERPGVEALLQEIDRRRGEKLDALRAEVERFFARARDPETWLEPLAQAFAGDRKRLGGRGVRRRLRRRLKKVRRQLEPAASGRPDFVHELRIRAKKLRYHAELLKDVFPEACSLARSLPDLSAALGEVHDRDVRSRSLLRQISAAPRAGLPGLALLLRQNEEERRACWEEACAEMQRFEERSG